ncbi:hypothetical protein C2E20_0949 isoform A [Micractinium conductrix]|uniref:Uncharacterized protein n=1 Tax=Micractinium conductrix TaxID=554055 RepID=A0A2P6VRT0_9CHLO|nr:hypothetical protein C2E20_0949 isoform A [Micractinium conductrix]|eukprot:PSC76799.1 hypothetical protein C2E20_0949 isoform A [Micractinium conductrix]
MSGLKTDNSMPDVRREDSASASAMSLGEQDNQAAVPSGGAAWRSALQSFFPGLSRAGPCVLFQNTNRCNTVQESGSPAYASPPGAGGAPGAFLPGGHPPPSWQRGSPPPSYDPDGIVSDAAQVRNRDCANLGRGGLGRGLRAMTLGRSAGGQMPAPASRNRSGARSSHPGANTWCHWVVPPAVSPATSSSIALPASPDVVTVPSLLLPLSAHQGLTPFRDPQAGLGSGDNPCLLREDGAACRDRRALGCAGRRRCRCITTDPRPTSPGGAWR